MLIAGRRGFLRGLGSLLCAPAIVRVESLMPIVPLTTAPLSAETYAEIVDMAFRSMVGRVAAKTLADKFRSAVEPGLTEMFSDVSFDLDAPGSARWVRLGRA